MGYTRNVISGFSWHTALKLASSVVTVAKIAVLARLLSPRDFGLFSLIAIALGLVEATTETGINITILQSKQTIRYFLNTAWVIAVLRGLIIAIIMTALGLFMGNYFAEPSLPVLVALAALVPFIKGIINPNIIVWRKNLEFFKDSLFRFTIIIFEAALAIALALSLKSVMALILAMIGSAIFEVIISFVFLSDRPVFQYVPNRAKLIFANGRGLSITAAFSYLSENLDDFLVGKLLGTHNLGLYHNGYALGHKVNYEFAKATHHGTVSVFPKIASDLPRLKRAWWRSTGFTLLLVSAASLPIMLFPHLAVQLLLGEQWLSIAPIVPWLVIAGVLQSLNLSTYSLFLSTKKYLAMNAHLIVMVVLMAGFLLLLGPRHGLLGAGWAIVLSRILSLPILFFGVRKLFRQH